MNSKTLLTAIFIIVLVMMAILGLSWEYFSQGGWLHLTAVILGFVVMIVASKANPNPDERTKNATMSFLLGITFLVVEHLAEFFFLSLKIQVFSMRLQETLSHVFLGLGLFFIMNWFFIVAMKDETKTNDGRN